ELDNNDISSNIPPISAVRNGAPINNNLDYNLTNNNKQRIDTLDSNTGALQTLDRRDPDGKDNDSTIDGGILDSKEKTYTTDVNGKVTVHVVVTINGNGTLADLKKQRMQIRNSNASPVGSLDESESSPQNSNSTDIIRFTGDTTQENVEYAKPKRCCVIQ
ncbi:uncharacterized protein LOC115875118, partial [Sitophilus oryzae]